MAWPTFIATSWDGLQKLFKPLDLGPIIKPNYYFRGQSDERWGLKTSLLRSIEGLELPIKTIHSLERYALQEYRSIAHVYHSTNYYSTLKTLLSWWASMQHHGVPTRLLDWTHSPFTAALFACRENFDLDAAIWVFQPHFVITSLKEKGEWSEVPLGFAPQRDFYWGEGNKPLLQTFRLEVKDSRMVTQNASFSISNHVNTNHEDLIHEELHNRTLSDSQHWKIVIPKALKPEILHRLKQMNISSASLFPGLDGMGKGIRETFDTLKFNKSAIEDILE